MGSADGLACVWRDDRLDNYPLRFVFQLGMAPMASVSVAASRYPATSLNLRSGSDGYTTVQGRVKVALFTTVMLVAQAPAW